MSNTLTALKSLCLSSYPNGLVLSHLYNKLALVVAPTWRKQSTSWGISTGLFLCLLRWINSSHRAFPMFIMIVSLWGKVIKAMWWEWKGRSILYREKKGEIATLLWNMEACHLPANGEDSDPHTRSTEVPCKGARLDLSSAISSLYLSLECCSLFLWPKVCSMSLATPAAPIQAAGWPDFPSHSPPPADIW